ncbi:MAG: 4Fe-4S binding protein [Neptuniibacter sp.]
MLCIKSNTLKTAVFALLSWILLPLAIHVHAVEMPLSPELQKLFPNASHMHQEDRDLSIIPVYRLGDIEGYAFRTAEIFPVRGYGGKPIDILIGLNPKGHYTGFFVVDHYEPIFVKGDGPQILNRYMEQLINVPASNNIYIRGDNQKKLSGSGKSSYIDGITNATVTTGAINRTITKAARSVARAKELAGYAPLNRSIPKADIFESMSFKQLLSSGLIKHWPIYQQHIKTAELDKKLGYPSQPVAVEGTEPVAELFIAYMSHPLVAKNLLKDAGYAEWNKQVKAEDQYLLILSKGLWKDKPLSEYIRIKQRGTVVLQKPLHLPEVLKQLKLPSDSWDEQYLLRLPQIAAFDPLNRTDLEFKASAKAKLKDVYKFPAKYFHQQSSEQVDKALWKQLWQQRQNEIALLLLGLVVLTLLFFNQHFAVINPDVFHKMRWAYLSFTLFFIGFYAQGQLSIVNILTIQHLLIDGSSLDLFLLDPVIFILGCYVLTSLILFGRGLFCGWLCPFGALQEFVGLLGKKLNIKPWKIKPTWHNRLQKLKYILLAGIIGASFYSLTLGEELAELEPFKTSMTLYFIREWQYVIYAVILLLLALKVHKFYCRYLCPLGASLAILGVIPIFNWLTRRAECGSPCQNCRMNCEIDAINKQGKINMRECVQCLECIVINNNPKLCAIEVAETKKQRRKAQYIEVVCK